MQTSLKRTLALLLAFIVVGLPRLYAQESNPSDGRTSGGWHKFGEPSPADSLPPPSMLTLPAGSWIMVRMDQPLSSDRNQPGDAFTATLAQPLVVSGLVIARRGQTVGGVVANSEKAGRVKGTSSLGLELTELSLVDGRQVPMKTVLILRRGETSEGRDAAAVGTATAIGASIGAVADGGFGAGIGAIAGAAASAVGVLVTRGRPTVVYPEDQLTFRLDAPIQVPVEPSDQAFQPVRQEDYEQANLVDRRPPQEPPRPTYYNGPYYPPYPYGGYFSPYFYGPSIVFYSHHGYYHHSGYYHHH